jgi:hypothetical protein
MTRLEEIANLFIQSYMKGHPVKFDLLDNEIIDFIENIPELKNQSVVNGILQEYEKSNIKKVINERLTQEVIADGQRALENIKEQENMSEEQYDTGTIREKSSETSKLNHFYKEPLNSEVLIYLQRHEDIPPLIYNLRLLIVLNDSVVVRNLHELIEADQYDFYTPNIWIFDRSSNINDVLNYVRNYYDMLRKEDEIEPNEFKGLFPKSDDYK